MPRRAGGSVTRPAWRGRRSRAARIWGWGIFCYVPSLRRVIGFSEENVPVTLYDPEKRTFEAFGGFRGRSPDGYALRRRVRSGKSRSFLVDLARGAYREVQTEPAPPDTGMSFQGLRLLLRLTSPSEMMTA